MTSDDLENASGEPGRLHAEVARLTAELRESQQREMALQDRLTGTASILRAIAAGPTDAQAVLQSIVEAVARLFETDSVSFFRADGDTFERMANLRAAPWALPAGQRLPIARGSWVGRTLLERRTIRHDDVDSILDEEYPITAPSYRARIAAQGPDAVRVRSLLVVPLLREDRAIGALSASRTEIRPFTDAEAALLETFADQAVIAIENARLFEELGERNRQVTEALERQTATASILEVIASSPTDVQLVLDAIVTSAQRLSDASTGVLWRVEGDILRGAAITTDQGLNREQLLHEERPIHLSVPNGRAVLERRTIRIDDMANPGWEVHPETAAAQRRAGFRSLVSAPLMRDEQVIGVLSATRNEVRPFTDAEVALIETFADQAVIAIENARLFSELEERNGELQASNRQVTEALEQQTALAEVLRVIASSPTNLTSVLDAIASAAARFTDSDSAACQQPIDGRFVGSGRYGMAATIAEELRRTGQPIPYSTVSMDTISGRTFLERRTLHVPDVATAVETEFPGSKPVHLIGRQRSQVSTPLLRSGEAIGVLVVHRFEQRPYTDQQIRLLEAFADQAVIAIENARLFSELEQRNAQLTSALDQQTATAEVLRVIASAPTDLDRVLDAIVETAARLCEAPRGVLLQLRERDGRLSPRARFRHPSLPPDPGAMTFDGAPGVLPTARSAASRAYVEGHMLQVLDMAEAIHHEYPDSQEVQGRLGYRTVVFVPLLRHGSSIGVLSLQKSVVEPFTEQQIALLETFADQAVIAIENARLFSELEQRNAQVTSALDQQTATAEVLRVIASAPTDLDRVLNAIVETAARLCDAPRAALLQLRERDGRLAPKARIGLADFGHETFESAPGAPATRTSAAGHAFIDGQTLHVEDMARAVQHDYPDSREVQRRLEQRTVVLVPLLRDGRSIGVLALQRTDVRPFTEQQIALVETFADQAVIAMENARLFEELQQSTAELARSNGEQQALAEVGQAVSSSLDVQEVLTTIISRAVDLAGADAGTVYELDAETREFSLRAAYQMPEELIEVFDKSSRSADREDTVLGRMARTMQTLQVPDITAPGEATHPVAMIARQYGYRSLLIVPLIREQRMIGALNIRRKIPGEFPQAVVELVERFASQSVLAIENARLFHQVEEKSRELEVASKHKSDFLANMSHELRTPLNAVIGYSEMLQEEAEEIGADAFLPDLQKINAAGKHLLGLINDILDLSKIEAGRMDLHVEEIEIGGLVRDVASIVRPLVDKNGNTLIVTCPEDIGVMRADLTKVRQTLFNLLSNASKFTEQGQIELRVSRGEDRRAMDETPITHHPSPITFTVSDTGIGMSEAQLGRIFEAFAQGDSSTSRRYGGSGLGLVISRHFCQMMGGEIAVTSQQGVGSTFTVTLPAEVVESVERAASDSVSPNTQHPTLNTRADALVIDDDPATRDLLARFLRAERFDVLVADGGEEGLRLAREHHPALITLDILMPGMDGWSVLATLKSEPATADIPVALVTILDDHDLGFALGATDYLTKPVDRERLTALARKYRPEGPTRRALVVEDDPATREMLRRLLERDGWSVDEAPNGRAGLERAAAMTPHLVLLDLMMPELDGFTFVERLRAEPAWRGIPVLVVTSKDLTVEERRRLNGKVERVIQKGAYSRDALLAEIRALVRASVETQRGEVQ